MASNNKLKKNKAPPARKSNLATEVNAQEEPSPGRLTDFLSKALRSFEQKLINDEAFKPTLAEYLKLLQIERELKLEAELPREITVTWIEPAGSSEEK
jgi:hypothetical protein